MTTRLARRVVVFALAIAAITLLLASLASLNWHYVHDSPLMVYAGWLVEQGAVPYRDFFDMNMPGTYFVMWVMGSIFGWDDFGFRVFDLLCLASISASTFIWMRRFGTLPALVASLAFPLWYIGEGPSMSMQREYIALVPFTWMLAIAATGTRFTPLLKAGFVGLLAAGTILIKPQFLLLCVPVLAIFLHAFRNIFSVRRLSVALLLGGALPFATTILYLLWTESLSPFLEMATNYWPLYTHMTGRHKPISGLHRLVYLAKSTRDGLTTFYFPMAIVGLTVLRLSRSQKGHAWVLGGMLTAAAFYPATAGQFWNYHWIPFQYIALCIASLSTRALSIKVPSRAGIAPVVGMIFVLFLLSSKSASGPFDWWKRHGLNTQPKASISEQVHSFLSSHLQPGDTVQPLDWARGAVHGMLMARAPLATRFMYNFHFYHHIDEPYIIALRREFLSDLAASAPRFIVDVSKNRSWPNGANTTKEFPELELFLENYYVTVLTAREFRILERTTTDLPSD